MMMHTLAPPPPEAVDDGGNVNADADADPAVAMMRDAPEVQKLVNTLGENLHVLLSEEIRKELTMDDKKRISRMIIGSAGALGIFLTNGAGETTREILFRVPMPPPPPSSDNSGEVDQGQEPNPSLVDVMIGFVDYCCNDQDALVEMRNVVASILRLFMDPLPHRRIIVAR